MVCCGMKLIIIALLLPFASIVMAAQPATLDHHRGNHRLLVVPAPTRAMEAELEKHRLAMEERDVLIIALIADAPTPIAEEIAARFQFTATSKEILLIGKDGNTTVRWPIADFTIENLFQRIDAMPMRQREMRER